MSLPQPDFHAFLSLAAARMPRNPRDFCRPKRRVPRLPDCRGAACERRSSAASLPRPETRRLFRASVPVPRTRKHRERGSGYPNKAFGCALYTGHSAEGKDHRRMILRLAASTTKRVRLKWHGIRTSEPLSRVRESTVTRHP